MMNNPLLLYSFFECSLHYSKYFSNFVDKKNFEKKIFKNFKTE